MAGTGGPVFAGKRREELAGAFQAGGQHYESVRPGYPAQSLAWLLDAAGAGARDLAAVLDVGAGTGKYTRLLVDRPWQITAVDPSADMLAQLRSQLPQVQALLGTAEQLPLPTASIDLAVVAQAWHWCEPLAASTELARVLRPGGTLGLIWNQLDVGVPWVHRLARIMHAGDVHKSDFRPALGPEFHALACVTTAWEQPLTGEDIMELAKSRSYYLRASPATREKVMANLRWYLFEHLGHTPGQELALPYRTQTWAAHTLTA